MTIYDGLIPRQTNFLAYAVSSKNRFWTRSLVKLGHNATYQWYALPPILGVDGR